MGFPADLQISASSGAFDPRQNALQIIALFPFVCYTSVSSNGIDLPVMPGTNAAAFQ